jgi:hypothetical protein
MLPACRTASEAYAIPTFDIVPSHVEGFMEELWEFQRGAPFVGCSGLSVMCAGMKSRCSGTTVSSWLTSWVIPRVS